MIAVDAMLELLVLVLVLVLVEVEMEEEEVLERFAFGACEAGKGFTAEMEVDDACDDTSILPKTLVGFAGKASRSTVNPIGNMQEGMRGCETRIANRYSSE